MFNYKQKNELSHDFMTRKKIENVLSFHITVASFMELINNAAPYFFGTKKHSIHVA